VTVDDHVAIVVGLTLDMQAVADAHRPAAPAASDRAHVKAGHVRVLSPELHQHSADLVQHPERAFARGYFLGDYMGLDNAGDDATAMFGQAFFPNNAS
jgi:hypothetical protein